MNKQRQRMLILGIGSFTTWVLVFSAGALVDSRSFREQLAPPDISATQPSTQPVTLRAIGANLIPAALLYTPTNAAILAALAGLIGGCASKLAVGNEDPPEIPPEGDPDRQDALDGAARRALFMRESPFISMLRGFVVYLTFLGGVLIAVSDPFKDPTGGAYLRYAGTISLIAFVMGYDPTRFEQLLAQIPTLRPTGGEAPRRNREGN